MEKNLIIGCASGYTWDQLRFWVNSIKKSGFTGDVVLCVSDITMETIEKLKSEGVRLSVFGKMEGDRFVNEHKQGC